MYYFVNYRKAFDTVKHDDLLSVASLAGLDGKDLKIINIYFNQSAVITFENQTTKEIIIKIGVERQGFNALQCLL